jgi:uncharacterized lipoprotein
MEILLMIGTVFRVKLLMVVCLLAACSTPTPSKRPPLDSRFYRVDKPASQLPANPTPNDVLLAHTQDMVELRACRTIKNELLLLWDK